MTKKPITPRLDIDNARWPDQIATMQASIANHESPFLPENLAKYHHLPVIKKGKHWYITKNQWPYPHTAEHYLIIAVAYWTQLEDITPEASSELISLSQWLKKHLHVKGGALCMRFGDSNYSGATIDHLHWQFIVPDLQAADYDRVKFSVGKKPAKLPPKEQL